MNFLDQCWLCQNENIRLIPQIDRVILETLTPVLLFSGVVRENQRSHRAIQDQDTFGENLIELIFCGVHMSVLMRGRFTCGQCNCLGGWFEGLKSIQGAASIVAGSVMVCVGLLVVFDQSEVRFDHFFQFGVIDQSFAAVDDCPLMHDEDKWNPANSVV